MDYIPEDERIIVDVLRQIIHDHNYCKEKISYNVPYFYKNKGVAIIWPSSIPRGGIKSGVLLGFWQGNLLNDPSRYLDRGTNKKIYYKIFNSITDIELNEVQKLLKQAIKLDKTFA